MFIKILNLINYFLFLIIDFILKFYKINRKSRTLLLIRLDSIGDYVLFRDYIRIIKESTRFSGFKITLCGNILWKDLAEKLDFENIDSYIWVDRKKFYFNQFYKYLLLKKIKKLGFEVVINPTYTREILFGDLIVKASCAAERIGSKGDLENHSKWKRHLIADRYYTKLLDADSENMFEFYRNREFFEELLGEKIGIQKPVINSAGLPNSREIPGEYVVIFPGAKDKKRRWSASRFSEIAGYIMKNYSLYIVLAGSSGEYKIVREIISRTDQSRVVDMTGKTNLSELAGIISSALLLISNETGAVHISAAVNTPFICVSNGNHYGRFNPYPSEVFAEGFYVYPEKMQESVEDNSKLKNELRFGSGIDINQISTAGVIERISVILNKIHVSK